MSYQVPHLTTVYSFAKAAKLDRPALDRKIKQANIEPVKKEGVAILYNFSDILQILTTGEVADAAKERARKDAATADLTELRVKILKQDLVPRQIAENAWSSILVNMRSRLMGLPHKLAPELTVENDLTAIQNLLEEGVREALIELVDNALPESIDIEDTDYSTDSVTEQHTDANATQETETI